MPWAEVMATPPGALRTRLEALERRRFRERAEVLEDRAMSNEINRGQELVGSLPPGPKPPYKIIDRPYDLYLRRLQRLAEGLPPEELPNEAQRRKVVENRKLADALLR